MLDGSPGHYAMRKVTYCVIPSIIYYPWSEETWRCVTAQLGLGEEYKLKGQHMGFVLWWQNSGGYTNLDMRYNFMELFTKTWKKSVHVKPGKICSLIVLYHSQFSGLPALLRARCCHCGNWVKGTWQFSVVFLQLLCDSTIIWKLKKK